MRRNDDGGQEHKRRIDLDNEIEFLLLATERQQINNFYQEGKLKDEARRNIERELDLRDAQLTNVRPEEGLQETAGLSLLRSCSILHVLLG